MTASLDGFDLEEFWTDSDCARRTYLCPPPTESMIASIEAELGYRLPVAYIALMRHRNGGIPKRTCFPTEEPTTWAPDHIGITSIHGFGRDRARSLCGELGSRFLLQEWGYPKIGIAICDCPCSGHDIVMLDYSVRGPRGEPRVVHVDQEADFRIVPLAPAFAGFVRGLVACDIFEIVP